MTTGLRYDLSIDQGSDYERTFPVTEDITGWTVAGQIRDGWSPTATLLYTLSVSVTADGVVVAIPGASSRDWVWHRGCYDIKVTSPTGARGTLVWGAVIVYPEVTRATG